MTKERVCPGCPTAIGSSMKVFTSGAAAVFASPPNTLVILGLDPRIHSPRIKSSWDIHGFSVFGQHF